jgi:MFS family permease
MVAFSFASNLWVSSLLLGITGFALLLTTAGANTALQTIADDDKRGRIMSLYTTAVTGLAPLGGLLAGLLAERIGASTTLRVAGLACLVMWIAFAMRFPRVTGSVRRDYGYGCMPDRSTRKLITIAGERGALAP